MTSQPIVQDVMTRDPARVAPGDPIRVAIDRMRERNCRRLPVVEQDRLVGIVSDRDLRRATNSPLVLRERWYDEFMLDRIPVRACMSETPTTVTPQTPVTEAAMILRNRKIGGLPVVEDDHLVGIITETDLLDFLIRMLER
jgi:acetoin utilization protein AcuB